MRVNHVETNEEFKTAKQKSKAAQIPLCGPSEPCDFPLSDPACLSCLKYHVGAWHRTVIVIVSRSSYGQQESFSKLLNKVQVQGLPLEHIPFFGPTALEHQGSRLLYGHEILKDVMILGMFTDSLVL